MKIKSKDFRVPPGEPVKLKEWPTIVKPICKSKKRYQRLLEDTELLGFGGIADCFVGAVKILFVVFLVFAILSFLGGGMRCRYVRANVVRVVAQPRFFGVTSRTNTKS